jgi:hypothetical protein
MSHRNDCPDAASAAAVRQMIMGFRTTQLIYAAAKLGIADLLRVGPREVSSLASATGAHPQALYRLLRALTSLGFFEEIEEGSFQLTTLGHTLRSDVPDSVRDLALLYGEEWLWQVYGHTLYSVMTGLPAFELVHDRPLFEYLNLHPEAASTFNQAMTTYSELEAAAVLAAYDFTGAMTVVDVGGGHGALLAALLKAHPQARGVLFDQKSVVDQAKEEMVRAGVTGRCTLTSGNFFESVPEGGDVYLLKSVLHDWEEAKSLTILKNCRKAMRPDARLLVIERVVPEGNAPSEAKLFDMNMLVVLAGKERTRPEYQQLFEAAGIKLMHILPTAAPLSILEGQPHIVS